MLELYHNDVSVCAQKVRLALAEKAAPWEDHHLVLRDGDHLKPDYLKLNANGVVPTLVDDGRVILESSVINEYLDARLPDPPLRPQDPGDLADMRVWVKKIDDTLHAAIGMISFCIAFRWQHLERDPEAREARLQAIPMPARRARVRQSIEMGIEAPAFADAILEYMAVLEKLETALADGREWLVADRFTLAEIAYTPYLTRLEDVRLAGLHADKPHVAAWFQRIKARPSHGRAMTEWQNRFYMDVMAEKGAEAWPKVVEIASPDSSRTILK